MRTPEFYERLEATAARLAARTESQDADAQQMRQKLTTISREVQSMGNAARKAWKGAPDGAAKASWEKAADALMKAEAACDDARAALFKLG